MKQRASETIVTIKAIDNLIVLQSKRSLTHTIPCNRSALASRSPESEFETGYVPQNGILNYSLVRKREKLGKCPVWERGGDTE